MTAEEKFKTSLIIKAKDAQTALIFWSSIYPNFSLRDLREGKLQIELRGREIRLIIKDEGLSKLRARINSILVWLDLVRVIIKTWNSGSITPSKSTIEKSSV